MKKFRSNVTSLFLGAAVVLILGSVQASASIIYDFQAVTPSGANFDWKYNARLSSDQKLGTGATDFAVVYDFIGAISAATSNVAPGLTLNSFLEATTSPQPVLQNVPDSSSIMNVHTTISGSLTPTIGTDVNIYTIDILSTNGGTSTLAYQSAQALKNAPGTAANGTPSGNSVQIEAPGVFVGTTPEPTTMLLFGSGLLGLGMLRKRVSKS